MIKSEVLIFLLFHSHRQDTTYKDTVSLVINYNGNKCYCGYYGNLLVLPRIRDPADNLDLASPNFLSLPSPPLFDPVPDEGGAGALAATFFSSVLTLPRPDILSITCQTPPT